jgi:hypothetical protein
MGVFGIKTFKKNTIMKLYLLFFSILVASIINAQCPANITLSTQSQIDSFPILYPNCKDFPGKITVKGPNITNILGLSNLKRIQTLYIDFNKRLNDLSGLDQLDTIRGYFSLNVNDSLYTLHGLEKLRYVGGSIYMNNNHFLQNLHGFSNLHTVKGTFDIIGTSPLQNLKGLDSLYEADELYISNNYSLVDYDGIQQLRKVDELSLVGNYAESVTPFANLDTIGTFLQITDHYFLTDISAFQNLKDIKGGRVKIRDNANLTDCAAYAICKAIANSPQFVNIGNNKPGCNSQSELAGDCLNIFNFSEAKGKIYADLDCNGLFDSTDVLLPNHFVRNQATSVPWATTTPDGTYSNLLVPFTTTSLAPDEIVGFSPQPSADTFVVNNGLQIFNNQDFRFCADSVFHNLAVSATPYHFPVRGFQQYYQICVKNLGTQPENAHLTFNLDSIGQANNQIIDAEDGQIIGNSIVWDIQNLNVFETRCFKFTLYCPPTAALSAFFDAKASVKRIPETIETDSTDNCYIFTQKIRGSYDPNDKSVSPESLYHPETADGNWLDYKIRFQNTGTFPATFIEVYDTLEAGLDVRFLEMQAASHAYSLSFPANNVLKWRFDNINLPDSTSDEPNSHGFIAFRIKTKPNLPANKIIRNRAGIYFDFNEVVLTEYAATGFYLVKTNEPMNNEMTQLKIYPNPAGNEFIIDLSTFEKLTNLNQNLSLEITDTNGRLLRRQAFSFPKMIIQRGNLPSGMLFLTLKTEEGRIFTSGRVVVE